MEAKNYYIIYNQNGVEKVDEQAYKNWLKYNWNNYNTGSPRGFC